MRPTRGFDSFFSLYLWAKDPLLTSRIQNNVYPTSYRLNINLIRNIDPFMTNVRIRISHYCHFGFLELNTFILCRAGRTLARLLQKRLRLVNKVT